MRTPEGEQLRAAAKVHVDTLLDVAAVDARAADSRTGRAVTTAHQTVASTLGCSAKTVQRARRLIEQLGFATTVVPGRYLTRQERADATACHGGDQRRIASERALLVPRPTSNVHLPRRGDPHKSALPLRGLPTRASARAGAATRQLKKRRTWPRPSLSVQRLAADLAYRLPWLARGHIGSLCHTLNVLGLDDTGWTAADVIDLIDQRNIRLHLYSLTPDAQRDPLALFAHQVRAALTDVDEPPRLRRARQATEHAHARATRAAEQARRNTELADPATQARIAAARQHARAAISRQPRPTTGPLNSPHTDEHHPA